ncbi:MAG: sulfatase [Lentisphaerales bacterium]|nr:sulfatase [Lentisphaerales bacterium]
MKNVLWTIFFVLTLGLTAAEKPNIIWIFSDDHSYQTIGAYGGRLAHLNNSPNIDSLAKEGMIFNRCYVGNSICAPARATLLTGKHSHKNGKFTNRDAFNHDQQQFQKILQKSGYQTAMIGKIHLNGKMQGFDYWEVLPGQGKYYDPDFITEEGKTSYKGYVTDIITDKALDWLQNKRDKNKPFMCMIHQKAPHRNWQPAQRHMDLYEDIEIPEPDNLFDDYSNRATPAATQDMSIEKTMTMAKDLKTTEQGNNKRSKEFFAKPLNGRELVKWKYQQYLKDFMRCTKAVDENVGRVLEYLKESGLEKNTIVMYSSDQGFYMGEHGWFDKRMMYEESYRTPFLVKWPGAIKPGSINTDLVQNIDFAPTFLDICGVEIPADMDGKSVVPLLKGEKPEDWRTHLYYTYYEYPGAHSVRRHEGVSNKRYKLIRYYGKDVENGEEWELFDLKTDPSEMKSQYNNPEYASIVADLKKELSKMHKNYKVPSTGVDSLSPHVERPKKKKKK